MSTGYGEGGYGLTPYGGPLDSIETAKLVWPSAWLPFFPDNNHYKILSALLAPADSFNSYVEAVQDAFHISTAEGKELEKLGELVDVHRRDAESDAKLRQRIILRTAAGIIEPTTDNVQRYIRKVYSATYSDFSISVRSSEPVLEVDVDSTVQTDSVFTQSEAESLITRALPAGHSASVSTV